MKLMTFLYLALCSATLAQAAEHRITLPPETAKLKDSVLPGHAIAMQKCAICHSADYIKYQPPAMSLKQWTAEVGKMQHAYGAPLSDGEVKQIAAYLATSYGSAKVSDPDVVAITSAPDEPAVPSGSGASGPSGATVPGAQALLDANHCLACHAVDKKVIGPAYHDVAKKYAGNPSALTQVETSIRHGGSGKWGTVAMPPFAGLSDNDVKTLAQYVLAQ